MTPSQPRGRGTTLPAAIILGLVGLGILVYVVIGYVAAIANANAQTTISPVGLLFAAAAMSALVTAWGLWQHRAWSRTPGRIVGVLGVLVGMAAHRLPRAAHRHRSRGGNRRRPGRRRHRPAGDPGGGGGVVVGRRGATFRLSPVDSARARSSWR